MPPAEKVTLDRTILSDTLKAGERVVRSGGREAVYELRASLLDLGAALDRAEREGRMDTPIEPREEREVE